MTGKNPGADKDASLKAAGVGQDASGDTTGKQDGTGADASGQGTTQGVQHIPITPTAGHTT